MTSSPVVLTPDTSVAEALARVRDPDLTVGVVVAGVGGPSPDRHPDWSLPGVCVTCSGCCASRRPCWSAGSSTPICPAWHPKPRCPC